MKNCYYLTIATQGKSCYEITVVLLIIVMKLLLDIIVIIIHSYQLSYSQTYLFIWYLLVLRIGSYY